MALFKKSKQTPDTLAGRRRPLQAGDDRPRNPGTMFSYYSQRSNVENNVGRREAPETVSTSRNPISAIAQHRVLALFVVAGLLVLTGYLLMLSGTPRVVLLQDAATAYFLQDKSVYQQTAEQSLAKSVFNRNKLTIDTATVRADLLKNYPEIENVSVALPIFGHQPQIYVEPYKPSFILTTTSNNAFLLDATGRALASTSQIPNIDKLGVPTLQDKTGNEIKLGNRAIPSSTVSFVQTVLAALKAKSVNASTLTLPAGSYELDVAIAGQPYYVKFNLENDALQQAGAFLATQNRLKIDKVTPATYIDVRVPDRAYYK